MIAKLQRALSEKYNLTIPLKTLKLMLMLVLGIFVLIIFLPIVSSGGTVKNQETNVPVPE